MTEVQSEEIYDTGTEGTPVDLKIEMWCNEKRRFGTKLTLLLSQPKCLFISRQKFKFLRQINPTAKLEVSAVRLILELQIDAYGSRIRHI